MGWDTTLIDGCQGLTGPIGELIDIEFIIEMDAEGLEGFDGTGSLFLFEVRMSVHSDTPVFSAADLPVEVGVTDAGNQKLTVLVEQFDTSLLANGTTYQLGLTGTGGPLAGWIPITRMPLRGEFPVARPASESEGP